MVWLNDVDVWFRLSDGIFLCFGLFSGHMNGR